MPQPPLQSQKYVRPAALCAHLINIGVVLGREQLVELGVDGVQEMHDLHGAVSLRVLGAELRKADDTAEEEGDGAVLHGRHWTTMAKLIGH